MEVLECIKSRRSIRKFSDEKLKYDTIMNLVEAGICCPTAQMREPWGFAVIQDKEELKKLSDAAKIDILDKVEELPHFKAYEKFFADPEYNIFYEAENLLIIYGDTTSKWYKEDCSALAENIMLAAYSQNIGTCWIGFAEYILNSREFREKYDIPANYEVVAPLIMGYIKYYLKPPKRREPIVFSKKE